MQESAFRETLTEADIYMSQMEFQYRWYTKNQNY